MTLLEDHNTTKDLVESHKLLLSKPFRFFSFHLQLEAEQKDQIWKDLYTNSLAYKIKILEETNLQKDDEINAISKQMERMHQDILGKELTIVQLNVKVSELHKEIEKLQKAHQQEISNIEIFHNDEIDTLHRQFMEFRNFVKEEVATHEMIQSKQNDRIKEMEVVIAKLK